MSYFFTCTEYALTIGEEQGSEQRVQHESGGVQAGRQAAGQVADTGGQVARPPQAQVGLQPLYHIKLLNNLKLSKGESNEIFA